MLHLSSCYVIVAYDSLSLSEPTAYPFDRIHQNWARVENTGIELAVDVSLPSLQLRMFGNLAALTGWTNWEGTKTPKTGSE